MLYRYLILAILIVFIYNSIWLHDCGLGCLTIADSGYIDITRCTCNACFCAPIQRYRIPAARGSVSQLLSDYTDRFHDRFAENVTYGRRNAQVIVLLSVKDLQFVANPLKSLH